MTDHEMVGERLPRGRHRLTREQVVRSQRDRIFRAMAKAMADKGYASTSVADVLRAAGVSRETFYEQFSSKEDCFMSALEAAVEPILADALDQPVAGGSPLERFERGLGAYLDALASHPAYARMFLIEVYAAGPAALRRRAAVQQRFARTLDDVFETRTAGDRFANEALVAATSAMVTTQLAAGDLKSLRSLRRPLTALAGRLHRTANRHARKR